MQYRSFGQLDWQGSALGFGGMRFPTLDGDSARIDEPEATRMVRYAIDQGVNYVDTAYGYHGGNSERFLGQVLKDGYRERVRLATKLPCWLVDAAEDFDRLLNEQLAKLQTDHIDFYLLHGLRERSWRKVRDLGVRQWARGAIADGRIRHLGFSFHDEYDAFEEIIDAYDGWTMCQIQHNYMNTDFQAGTEGLRYAASKGLAVVIMEPLLGGSLADPPDQIRAIWDTAADRRSAADWALQWLWNQPEVSVVLSGMSTMEQVEQNIASADVSGVGTMTASELALFERAHEKYERLCAIPCTKCGYCMPCPNGVNIPRNFEIYNYGVMHDDPQRARGLYGLLETFHQRGYTSENTQAAACIQCRECEEKCPQNIPVSEWMPVVHQVLGEDQPYVCELP